MLEFLHFCSLFQFKNNLCACSTSTNKAQSEHLISVTEILLWRTNPLEEVVMGLIDILSSVHVLEVAM